MSEEMELKLQNFFGQFREISYEKGEVILGADEEPEGVYFIKKGNVKLYAVSKEGTELTLNIFKEGSYFPMTWALGDEPNRYYFEAMGKVVVNPATKRGVTELLKDDPEVLFELTERIVSGLGGLIKRMENIFFGSARSRVALAVLLSARRFGKERKNGQVVIDLPLSHQEVAGLAGLTRETTSLEMKKLAEEKVICYRRKYVVVLNMERLEDEVGY